MTLVFARIAAMIVAGLITLLPACTQRPEPHGFVTGLLVEVGGPADYAHPDGIRLLVPGRVTATGLAATLTVTADRHGRFRFSLPPGVYHLTAQSGGARCGRVHSIHVQPGTVTRGANVLCSVP
jgi:hypothetical protein